MRACSGGIIVALFAFGCSTAPNPDEEPDPGEESGGAGGGGSAGSGGKGGGGQLTGGTGGGSSAAGGAGGQALADAGASGGATTVDASAPPDAQPSGSDAGGDSSSASDPSQGPVAEGNVVFSRDFENGMEGMTRSPPSLPEDRIQIVDDPVGQRGKVVRIHFQQGDNFRTSGGTEPRSWFSSAKGYTVRPGTKVSVAWGFMWENPNMGAHFAQIIRDGGPLWMFGVDQGGTVAAAVHRGSGRTGGIMKLEPMKWYDFRVDTDYRGGGSIKFFINGKQVGQGTGAGGAPARFDCGIYWMHNAKPTRTVYVSNVSIGEF